jgi:AcrR family transcriptional regulator
MRRGIHKGLTPEKILDESSAMLDAGGPAALTMRGLARRLNVAAMAIYNHFQDRDAILDALADRVFADLSRQNAVKRRTSRKQPWWKEHLRSILLGAQEVASRHPHIYRLAMTRPNKPAAALQLSVEALTTLRSAGLTETQATTVYHTFVILLHGFPFWREGFEREMGECVPGVPTAKGRKPEVLSQKQFMASVEWLLNSIECALPAKVS